MKIISKLLLRTSELKAGYDNLTRAMGQLERRIGERGRTVLQDLMEDRGERLRDAPEFVTDPGRREEREEVDALRRRVQIATLTAGEIEALEQRIELANVFDRRGPEIRMLAYAEKHALLPRLVVTLRRMQPVLAAAIALESAASRGAYMREHLALCEAVRALKETK